MASIAACGAYHQLLLQSHARGQAPQLGLPLLPLQQLLV